ncbi:MAG: aminopeptidase P N-terminal domain-containing protein [Bacteroidales bacterium]|jgi:Xaa-Pro aminopeptidase|nr:aminopeptidase P N-terminal domain-containing protein [Bacteroidales bacterium]
MNLPASFFENNRKRLTSVLEEKALVLLFSNDKMPRTGDQCFPFRQNSNLFYLSGINQPQTVLALCPEHPEKNMREILFMEENTAKAALWEGDACTEQQAEEISGVKTVFAVSEFDTVLQNLMYHSQNVYFDMSESVKFSSFVPSAQQRHIQQIQAKYPLHTCCRLFPFLRDLRLIKSEEELSLMQHACNITAKAFDRVLRTVKPGTAEYQIEAEITHEFIRSQIRSHAFDPIVASGKNACVLHYSRNHSVCKDGDLLLLDFGAEYRNYAADLSRTIPVNGTFSARQKQVYDACYRVYEYAKTLFVPGMSIAKVYKKVCAFMELELIGLGLFSKEDVQKQHSEHEWVKKYFMHGISHFVGLDVHDVGTTDIVFDENMVLSCEPGIYIPNESVGIRIETMMLVRNTPIDLMADVPVKSEDIERLMKERNLS